MGKKYKIGSSEAQTLTYAAEVNVLPVESKTIATVALTGDMTLNLDSAAEPVIGDELILVAASDGTARDVTFGTGITGPVLAGVISKTKVQSFVYNGTAFVAIGAPVQID